MSSWEGQIEQRGHPRMAVIAGGPPMWAIVRLSDLYRHLPPEQQPARIARDWAITEQQAAAALAFYEAHQDKIQEELDRVEAGVGRSLDLPVQPGASPASQTELVLHIERRGDPEMAVIAGGPPVWAVIVMGDLYDHLPGPVRTNAIHHYWGITQQQAAATLAYYEAHRDEIKADVDRVLGSSSAPEPEAGSQTGAEYQAARPGTETQTGGNGNGNGDDNGDGNGDDHGDDHGNGTDGEPLSAVARVLILLAVWLLTWLLFVLAHHKVAVWAVFLGTGVAIAGSFVLLFRLFLCADENLPDWSVFVGFILAFAGLVGAYAAASLVASHGGMSFHSGVAYGCYRDATGPTWLHGLDAVYVALGTLSTAGSGDLVAHGHLCRGLGVGELWVGFALLGLTVSGVAARLFNRAGGSA